MDVIVTYKKMQRKLSNDYQILLEKKIAETRRVKGLEEEVTRLKFQLSQSTDLLQHEKKMYLVLENEASKLRGARSVKSEKIEKSDSLKITRSAEYQNLLKTNKLLKSGVTSSKKQIFDLKSTHKNLCSDISRALKLSLEEALIRKAKRDMYLRKIKAVQEGNLEGLEGIIAEIIAAIADSKE